MPPREPSNYNAGSITVLEGLEAVRKRPGMYIGSTGERGLHHLVWEVVDNAVDEALAGYCDTVRVTLLADGGVRVQDNGRGIPVDRHPVEKRPAVEVVLTTLHSGGKFDGKSYAVSGGLHGVGVSVVNALSSRLDVEIHRDGFVWTQPYVNTAPAAPLHKGAPTRKHGTTLTFWADDTIFETTSYSFETITSRLQEMAFLNRGLTIVIRDEREDTPVEVTYHYKGGIEDFVRHLNASKGAFHKSVIGFGAEGEGIAVEVAMQWNDSYGESVYTFANTINTHEGGTHEEGFRSALTSIVNKYADDKKLLKGKDERLTGDDIREGLAAIVSVKLANPQFEGQTKTKLGNTEARSFVQTTTYDWLGDWLERNPSEARVIITKASAAARARRAAQEARKLARKSLLTSSSLPGKLADCRSTDPRESEIYVVEGDSAGGCFVGSTQVSTVEGRSYTFAKLAADWEGGVSHFGYATDENGDVVVMPLVQPRLTRRHAELVEVTLDEGRPIRCTPDHLFRLRDGSYRRADELQTGDSLMPLNRRPTVRGEEPGPSYEMVWANGRGRWEHTHHLADQWNLANGRAAHYSQGPVRHHVDFDKRNNDPRNLLRMTHQGHIAHHVAHAQQTLAPLWKDPEFRERKLRSLSENARKQWENPAFRAVKSEQVRAQRQDPELNQRERHSAAFRAWWAKHPEHAEKITAVQHRNWANPEFALKVRTALHDYRTQVPSDVRVAKIREGHRREALRLLNRALRSSGDVRAEYERLRRESAPTLVSYDTLMSSHYEGRTETAYEQARLYNHSVVSVRRLAEREDVYDLTVEKHHNFALDAGVFVHNSAKSGRDSMFQAILPIRGKIINVEKVRLDRALKNNEVQALITALGTGIHDDFDLAKLRYHKVILMADADVDGQHIRTLLLTLLFRFMRPLIEDGKVYLACPPLYKIKWGGKGGDEYAYSDRERDALIKVGVDSGRRLPKEDAIQRYKGLGEMNAKELWETTMDPATRLLLQVTLDDAAQADALFSTLMGEDVEARRSFITRNARDVRFLDI